MWKLWQILTDLLERAEPLHRNSDSWSSGFLCPKDVRVEDFTIGTQGHRAISCLVAFVTIMTVHVWKRETDPTLKVKNVKLGVSSEHHGVWAGWRPAANSETKDGCFGFRRDVTQSSKEPQSFQDGSEFSNDVRVRRCTATGQMILKSDEVQNNSELQPQPVNRLQP